MRQVVLFSTISVRTVLKQILSFNFVSILILSPVGHRQAVCICLIAANNIRIASVELMGYCSSHFIVCHVLLVSCNRYLYIPFFAVSQSDKIGEMLDIVYELIFCEPSAKFIMI